MKELTSEIKVSRIQNLFTEIAKFITSSIEIPKIVAAIMEQVEIYFQPDNWSLFLIDPTTQELYFVVAKGLDSNVIKKIRIKIGEGIVGHVAQTAKPMLIENVSQHPLFSDKVDKASGFKTSSIIAVPILFQKQVLGVIELINTYDKRQFSQEELTVLETIADFSAIALNNAMVYERMLFLALHDPLSNLYNRFKLNHLIDECNNPSEGENELTKICVVAAWIDIDNFKKINDDFGHHTGDQVLSETAKLLQECCRKDVDMAFRVGGDEFLILILNLDQEDVEKTMKRLKKQLEICSGFIQPATGFSFGMASGFSQDLQEVIKHADNQMYFNKRHRKEKA